MPSTFSVRTTDSETLEFEGDLIVGQTASHQPQRNYPTNTELVQLFKETNGGYLLSISFKFEDMEPHRHEVYQGTSPQVIFESIEYPTDLTIEVFKSLQAEGLSDQSVQSAK